MGKDIKKKGVPTKRLEPMHTPVPHEHDGTRAHLGGGTPTTVLESALKQVTFTAILPVRREILAVPVSTAAARHLGHLPEHAVVSTFPSRNRTFCSNNLRVFDFRASIQWLRNPPRLSKRSGQTKLRLTVRKKRRNWPNRSTRRGKLTTSAPRPSPHLLRLLPPMRQLRQSQCTTQH